MPLLRSLVTILRSTARIGPAKPAGEISRILVAELTRLGDLLVAFPALHALRGEFPEASIVFAVDSRYSDVVRWALPFLTPVSIEAPSSIPAFLRGLHGIRKEKFDLAVSMSPAHRNAACILASRSHRKVGYLTSLDSLTPYLHETPVESIGMTLKKSEAYGRDHISQRGAKILSAIGIPATDTMPIPDLPAAVTATVRDRLTQAGISPSSRYVSIQPLSGWAYRTWSEKNFAALAGLLNSDLGLQVAFLAPGSQMATLERIRKNMPSETPIAILQTDSILEAAGVIRGSALFVGNDSGPLHLAALLGVPSIGLFGPAPPSLTGPIGKATVNIYQHVECSPCDQRRCIRPDNPCIGLITPENVLEAARRLSSHTSPAGD